MQKVPRPERIKSLFMNLLVVAMLFMRPEEEITYNLPCWVPSKTYHHHFHPTAPHYIQWTRKRVCLYSNIAPFSLQNHHLPNNSSISIAIQRIIQWRRTVNSYYHAPYMKMQLLTGVLRLVGEKRSHVSINNVLSFILLNSSAFQNALRVSSLIYFMLSAYNRGCTWVIP